MPSLDMRSAVPGPLTMTLNLAHLCLQHALARTGAAGAYELVVRDADGRTVISMVSDDMRSAGSTGPGRQLRTVDVHIPGERHSDAPLGILSVTARNPDVLASSVLEAVSQSFSNWTRQKVAGSEGDRC